MRNMSRNGLPQMRENAKVVKISEVKWSESENGWSETNGWCITNLEDYEKVDA